MKKPVLIFNAVEHVSLAIARCLCDRGIAVTLADVSGAARLPRSRAILKTVHLPNHRSDPDQFFKALSNLIRSESYDMLLPSSDVGLAATAAYYSELSSLLHVGCPPPEIVKRVLDKRLTLEAAEACGIRVPRTFELPTIVVLDSLQSELPFPIVAKPHSKEDESRHSFKMRYFAAFQDLRNAFLQDPEFGTSNLFQEYCPGEGVGVELLLHNQQPVGLFQHRRLKELPVTGGGTVMSVSESVDPDLADQALALLRKIQWQGVAMVEFKCDRSKRQATLMEVNGRYWGSLPLAIGAGLEFPFYEWQIAHGEQPEVPWGYRAGLHVRWVAGDCLRLASLFTESPEDGFPRPSKWLELRRFFADFAVPACPAMWSWTDPLPAVNQLTRTLLKPVLRPLLCRFNLTIGKYRSLGWPSLRMLLRIRLLDAFGLRRMRRPRDLAHICSVLFVCHGNIIRSALAEALLRKHMGALNFQPMLRVSSAGFIYNERTDERAKLIATEFGVSLDDGKPQRLTPKMIAQADLILVMDRLNEARLLTLYPAAKQKAFFLTACSDRQRRPRSVEIPDPFLGTLNDVRQCCQTLDLHVRKLAEILRAGRAPLNKASAREVLQARAKSEMAQ